jgi:hypothetical protein
MKTANLDVMGQMTNVVMELMGHGQMEYVSGAKLVAGDA